MGHGIVTEVTVTGTMMSRRSTEFFSQDEVSFSLPSTISRGRCSLQEYFPDTFAQKQMRNFSLEKILILNNMRLFRSATAVAGTMCSYYLSVLERKLNNMWAIFQIEF